MKAPELPSNASFGGPSAIYKGFRWGFPNLPCRVALTAPCLALKDSFGGPPIILQRWCINCAARLSLSQHLSDPQDEQKPRVLHVFGPRDDVKLIGPIGSPPLWYGYPPHRNRCLRHPSAPRATAKCPPHIERSDGRAWRKAMPARLMPPLDVCTNTWTISVMKLMTVGTRGLYVWPCATDAGLKNVSCHNARHRQNKNEPQTCGIDPPVTHARKVSYGMAHGAPNECEGGRNRQTQSSTTRGLR